MRTIYDKGYEKNPTSLDLWIFAKFFKIFLDKKKAIL